MIPTDYITTEKPIEALPPLCKFKPIRKTLNLVRQEALLHQSEDSSKVSGIISSQQLKTAEDTPSDINLINTVQRVAEHVIMPQNFLRIHKPKPHYLPPLQKVATSHTLTAEAQKDLDRDLRDSILTGDLETFKTRSEAVVDINRPLQLEGLEEIPPLIWTIVADQPSICKYLIEEREASIDTLEGIEKGALPVIFRSLDRKALTLTHYLLRHGAFLNKSFLYNNQQGRPIKGPLTTYYAAIGDTERLQVLVECLGADVNIKDSKGKSPLYYILEKLSFERDQAKRGNLKKAAELLVNYDADVDETDKLGNTLLMRLAEKGHLSGVQMLAVDFAADTQATNLFKQDALNLILNSLDNPNLSKLDISIFSHLFNFLMYSATNKHLRMKLGEQVHFGNERACALLLNSCEFNIDDSIDTEENTFLIHFTKSEMLEHVEMLLNLGADPQRKNLKGESAYSYAKTQLKNSDQTSMISWRLISQVLTQAKIIREASYEEIKKASDDET